MKTPWKFPSLKVLLDIGARARLFSLLISWGVWRCSSFSTLLCDLYPRFGAAPRKLWAVRTGPGRPVSMQRSGTPCLPADLGVPSLQPALCTCWACLACARSQCPWKHWVSPVWTRTFCSVLFLLHRLCASWPEELGTRLKNPLHGWLSLGHCFLLSGVSRTLSCLTAVLQSAGWNSHERAWLISSADLHFCKVLVETRQMDVNGARGVSPWVLQPNCPALSISLRIVPVTAPSFQSFLRGTLGYFGEEFYRLWRTFSF